MLREGGEDARTIGSMKARAASEEQVVVTRTEAWGWSPAA